MKLKRMLATISVTTTLLLSDADLAAASPLLPVTTAVDYVAEHHNPFEHILEAFAPAKQTVRKVNVIAREYQFVPNVIEVKSGTRVTLVMQNQGREKHNITFRTLPLKSPTVDATQSASLSFTAPKPGRYIFYCSVDKHAHRGMTGVLVVTK